MKKTSFTNSLVRLSLSVLLVALTFAWSNAQVTFNGSATNTAGNSSIPSAGSGSCFSAPQTAGGTVFEANVTCAGTNLNAGGATINNVTINLTHTWDSDLDIFLESPSGDIIELTSDNGGTADNYTNTVFQDGAPSITTGSAPFTGTFSPEGSMDASCGGFAGTVGTFAAMTGSADGTWKLIVMDDVGGDSGSMIGWSISFDNVTIPTCDITTPLAALNLGTSATACVSDPISIPATTGDCMGMVVTYSVDGGATQTVPAGDTTIPGLEPGIHTIDWSVTNACNQTTTASQTVTVSDTTDPVVNCPSDMFFNLDAGECSTVVNFNVTGSDNCPFTGPAATLTTTPGAPNNGNAAGGIILFDLENNSGGDLNITELSASIDGPSMIDVYMKSGTGQGFEQNMGAWTLVATGDATAGPFGTANRAPFSVNFTIPTGVTGIALHMRSTTSNYTNGIGGGGAFGTASNSVYDDGTLKILCGSSSNSLFGSFAFNPRVWNGSVTYQGVTADAPVVQTMGLPSGSTFPIGTTTNCFELTDLAGNVGSCCFDVNVAEFANPTSSLTCNDNVQISLDETCSAIVGADDVLEGGPYRCYDNYDVAVLSPVGQNLGNVVNASFIGNVWTVKVTDPVTGNYCWGSIRVEDKLAPVITCDDITLPCTLPSTTDAGGPLTFASVNVPVAITDNNTVTSTIDVSGLPQGAVIADVDLVLDIDHTWIGDLTVEVENPDGVVGRYWDRNCAFTDNLKVTFDDEDPDCVNACAAYTVGNVLRPIACLLPLNVGDVNFMDIFDGGSANGTWTLSVSDGAGGDQGTITGWSLIITYLSACDVYQPNVTDNCGSYTLESFDSEVDGSCGGAAGTVLRTWIATDASGNEDQCVQEITLARPDLDDVLVPKDIKWTCTQYNAFPNIIDATHLHRFISDTDPSTDIIDVNLDPFCDDDDFDSATRTSDAPKVNSTNTANGGNGCPGGVRTPKSNPGPNSGLDDADVLELTGSGVPTVGGEPLIELCEIATDYEDIWITVCEGANGETGTFKIVRQWTLIDWCANPVDVRQINQVIKVVDELAPVVSLPTTTLNNPHIVDVYNSNATGSIHTICEGSVIIPAVSSATDNCSGVASYTTEIWTVDANGNPVFQLGTVPSNTGIFNNIPLFENGLPARYIIRYYASDYCDNQGFRDLYVRLRDRVPPVVVCDEITEVSITNNGNATGESCSNLRAEDLDDGSYDNCTPVYFLMAKMDDANVGAGIFNRCYYPTRDFCCEDLGDNTVILLVLDQDPTPFFNTTIGTASLGCDEPTPSTPSLFLSPAFNAINYNTCMVTVQVTDKLAPVNISCPPNQRVTCDWWADNIETDLVDDQGNEISDEDQCDVLSNYFGTATYFDNCDAIVTCSINNGLDQCLEGRYVRTWSATDAAGNFNSAQNCRQTIWVDHVSDWSVEFPADLLAECGEDEPDFGEPIIFKESCELVAVSFVDELFTDEPGVCYKILRTWTVINWCVVGEDIDQEVVELSEAELWNQGVTNLLDRDINMDGYFSPQEVNSNKSYRTYRDSWNNTPGRIHKPTAALNPTGNQSHNTNITNPDTDPDSDPWDGYITYQQVIKVIDTVDPVFTNGCQIDDICIGDNTCSATVVLPSPDITECSANVDLSVQIQIGGAWLNGFGPYLNVAPGTYDVRYVAMDNCNNQTACESTVTVVDCKKPTPYCKNGIVVELMVPVNPGDEAMVDVWASDLNDASFDNCPGDLKFSFSSDVSDIGNTYTCDDLGQNSVDVWVTDAAGNQDFCTTSINIQANMGQCNDDPLIAGATATEMGEGVQNVNVNINSPSGFDQSMTTDVAGAFGPLNVPAGGDYTVTPVYDEEPLNGVTTYDLVMISKHILGVELLDSPYQIIAADANNSRSVTTFDLVEIRKLILFINTEFPNNTSWRFVDKDFTFANPANPFAADFPEVINYNNLDANRLAADFVAIKVGDVNRSASVNLTSTEDRTLVGDLVLNTDDVILSEGETYTVEFKATDFAVSGYQFTLNFDKNALDFDGVVSGLANEANFGMTMVNEGVITTSWNSNEVTKLATDEVVFGLTFTAKQSGRLSNMLNVNSRYTVAEAYTADAELLNVALSFNNTLVANGFELYQNTPNPFASTTAIGFYLPEATSATLTISDVQGKVVKVISKDFAKGYNQVDLKRTDLGATGVLYYRLDTDNESATRKMILVD